MLRPFVLIALSCALAACTTHSHHGSLQQAPAMRPPPSSGPMIQHPPSYPGAGYAPAGAGAPVLGQPGQRGTDIPRSPNKRLLPPSWEPGLWAADGAPQASTAPLRILDVELAVVDAQHLNFEGLDAGYCVRSVDNYISLTEGLKAAVITLTAAERGCFVAQLFLTCNEGLSRTRTQPSETWREMVERLIALSKTFWDARCGRMSIGSPVWPLAEKHTNRMNTDISNQLWEKGQKERNLKGHPTAPEKDDDSTH